MSPDPRYALAGEGGLTYAIEDEPYEQADDPTTDPGITNEDIDPPNPNEHQAMPHGGGGREVFVNAPLERDYEFDVPTVVHDEDAPFELVLGSRTESDEGDYTKVLFEETSVLPTATFRHFQDDLDLVSYYTGCKASMDIEWATGDPLQAAFSITAAAHEYDPEESPTDTDPSLDPDVSPYMAHMAGDLSLSEPDNGGVIKDLATVSSGALSWDNGLEAQHHGGDPGRDAFSIAETTAADGRYDWTVTANVHDTETYQRAYENDEPVDFEQPFVRQEDDGTMIDAVIVRGKRCEITDSPIPSPGEGVIEADIALLPTWTEIEIRVPNGGN